MPVVAERAKSRVLFIDNLRILLTTLVILHHLSITYGGQGDWYYNEQGTVTMFSTIALTLFVAINQSYFMGLFLMIASYLIPSSFERKGATLFLVDRFKRLGIPILFYTFVIQPFLVAVLRAFRGDPQSFWQSPGFGLGPMWFVETLLVLSIGYVLWQLVARAAPAPHASKAPGNFAIALFALALGVLTFVVRIGFPVGWWFEPLHLQIAHFAQYIALFIVGIIAYRRNWLVTLADTPRRVWLWLAILLVPLFLAIGFLGGALKGNVAALLGGIHWQSFAYAVWEQLMAVAMVVILVGWFRKQFDTQSKLARILSADSYAVFVFHPLVIVPLALALSSIQIEMGLKFVMVAPIAVGLCFIIGHYIRKLPVARDIL